MDPQFVYRAFHSRHSSGVNSADGFLSGVRKSEHQDWDSDSVRKHFNASNRDPTPWISTTTNMLRAIKRAHQLSDRHGIGGVSIAVIDIAECQWCDFNRADDLADAFGLADLPWHSEEYMFRWRIPGTAIVSCLALRTLERRGLYGIVPELLEDASADAWKEMIRHNWMQEGPDRHLQAAGRKAARFGFLFGDGEHVEHIGLEAAQWWERRVGRIVKDSFYDTIDFINDTPGWFDE